MTIIATWNVNSVRTRIKHLEKWITERSPDIILLQELKCQKKDFPFAFFNEKNYNVELVGQKSYNGVAILSKHPIEDMQYKLPTLSNDDNARYIEAFTNGIRVASVYVPNGQEVNSEKFIYKMQFMDALAKHASSLLSYGENLVIGGDYNIAPNIEDGHEPERFKQNRILCSHDERAKMHQLLNTGFVDAIRIKYKTLSNNQDIFSWWDYRAGSFQQNKGYRIDHLLLSSKTADNYIDCGVDKYTREEKQPSDHAPVWIEITRN